jgi:hypothetical protein
VRVRMRIILKLKGTDSQGNKLEISTATENASAGGFLCNCSTLLSSGSILEVFLTGATDRYVGRARVVRVESPGTPWQRCAFQFTETTSEWILSR